LVRSSNFQHRMTTEVMCRDPLRLIDNWDNRAAAFFASLAFALATICTNISANSLSAANDFTALMPRVRSMFPKWVGSRLIVHFKWLNIRRGQILCAFIGGWVICPWEILANAIGFLNFMAGYTVFLGPIAGIMIADVGPDIFVPNLSSSCFSTGSYTVEISTFHRSTDRKVVINILVVWYVHPFGLLLCPDTVSSLVCIELACCCCPPCLCTAQPSRFD
jgi:Permease for cytosine/purines, uracil, thiamine, allantoin